jgi:hypothetical protein
MYLWQISLYTILIIIQIGVILRVYADLLIVNPRNGLKWSKDNRTLMDRVKEKSIILWLIIMIKRFLIDTVVSIFWLSIPIYFI